MPDMVQVSANTPQRHRHASARSRRVLGSPSRRYVWFPLSLLFGVATWGMYLYLGLHTGRRRYLLLSAILYAPGTALYVWSRREQRQRLFTPVEAAVFVVLAIGGAAGVFALASGRIEL